MPVRHVRSWTYRWWKPRSCKNVKTWIMKAKNILNCTHRNLCCTGHFCLPTFWDWFIANDNLDSWFFSHLISQLSTPWYHLIEGLVCSFISSNVLFVSIVLFVSSFVIFINFPPLTYNSLIPSLRMSPLISFVIEDGSEKLKKRCHLPPIANPLKFYFFSPLLFSDVSSSLNLLLSLTSTQQEVTESSLKISETRCTCCNEQDIFCHFARIGEVNFYELKPFLGPQRTRGVSRRGGNLQRNWMNTRKRGIS